MLGECSLPMPSDSVDSSDRSTDARMSGDYQQSECSNGELVTLHLRSAPGEGTVSVDAGQVDGPVATLWWALAQQTARIARRSDWETAPSVSDGEEKRRESDSMRNEIQLETRYCQHSAAQYNSEMSTFWSANGPGSIKVASAATDAAEHSRSRSQHGSSGGIFDAMSSMNSPRLVREISRKYPPRHSGSVGYVGGLPVYVYDAKEDIQNGVQLLRYVKVSQSASAENISSRSSSKLSITESIQLPTADQSEPKAEPLTRKFDSSSIVQLEDVSYTASSMDCIRYESQELGRDDDEDPSTVAPPAPYFPIVVVAIDFGTTYSGYAFSFVHDPEDVHMMRKWEGSYQIVHFLQAVSSR